MSIKMRSLAENVPEGIIRGAKLGTIVNELFETFAAGEEQNNELFRKFFKQSFFRGGESFIDKCAEVDSNIDFDYIKDEAISLALLLDKNQLRDLQFYLYKIKVDNVEEALKQEIFDKIKSKIGGKILYNDFDEKCEITLPSLTENDTSASVEGEVKSETLKYQSLTSYFNKVINYLQEKERDANGENVEEILRGLVITNEDLNKRLPAEEQIPAGVPLKDSSVPKFTREAFDMLLSFQIGEVADCAINITNNVHNKLESLLYNSMPTVNTIIGEDDDLKYDENKLISDYPNYKQKLDEFKNKIENLRGEIDRIKSDGIINEEDKQRQINEIEKQIDEIRKQINSLRWDYYLKYLQKENNTIGNILQKLYDNDFDYSKIEPSDLENYLNKVADRRIKILLENGITEAIKANFGNRHPEEFDQFIDFYKNLVNPSKNKIEFLPGIELPVEKEIINEKNKWLKEINEFGDKSKYYDTLPIRYKIKKTDVDSLPLSEEDKNNLHSFLTRIKSDGKEGSIIVKGEDGTKHEEPSGKTEGGENYIIEGGEIGMLMYLFFTVNARQFKTEASSENQEKLKNLGGKNKKSNLGIENNEGESLTPEQFKEKIEKFGSAKFENGSEIWLPIGDSEIPGGGYQWMKIKISKVDMKKGTFVGTIFGGELKLDSKREGKSKKFKMNQKFFDDLERIVDETSASNDNIRLLPDPDGLDFNPFVENLHGKLGTSAFTFPPNGLTWNGSKFIKKINKDGEEEDSEVEYFGVPGDDKSTYKIEYHPMTGSFTVSSSFNGEEKGKGGKPETKRFAYKREMDWNNFLIFFTQKGLTPQTEEESKRAIQRQNQDLTFVNGGKWKLYWFSLNNLKNGFKDIIGSLKKGIEEYDKRKTKDFKDIVESPMLRALSKMPLRPSLKYAVGERQQEIYNEEFNGAWTEIERYLKELQSDDQFADTFEWVPPHVQSLYGTSYKKFITDLFDKKGETSTEEKRKAAALLLANIQKGGSPFRGLSTYENEGLWVKAILGNKHYDQFMMDKAKCIDDLKQADDGVKEQLEDVLATCEMDYIMNNINGANGKLKYFGSHEKRGIPGEEGTDYIPNPSKRLLSEKFAKELKTAYKGWFNRDAVESSFSEIKHNDFNLAREDFKRFIKSSRFPQAISNLKKMFTLAEDDKQKADYQKCFLIYMLSGVLDFNGKKDLREQAYQRAKTMSFLPGMLAKNVGHSDQVAILLDDFCNEKGYPKFSTEVKSFFHPEDLQQGKTKIDNLIQDMDKWWDVDKMRKFEEYSKSSFPSKNFPKGSVLDKLKEDALKSDMENIDNSLLENPIVANSGGLLSNANVVRDRMLIKNYEFDGKDNKEKDNRKKFWNQITKEVKDIPLTIENTKLLLKQYLDRFQIHDNEKTYRRIKTAYERKKEIGNLAEYQNDSGEWDSMGIITEKEIKSILRYTFQGTVMSEYFGGHRLPEELKNALNMFQTKFEEAFTSGLLNDPRIVSDPEVFGIGNEARIKPLFVGSWDKYNQTVTGRENSDDDDKKEKNRVKRNFISGNFINHDIANLERRLKNLPSGDYYPVTTGDLDALYHRFRTTP